MSPANPVSASLEPRTEAGKALVMRYGPAFDSEHERNCPDCLGVIEDERAEVIAAVLAIEEQAATEARRELLAKVEGLPEMTHHCRYYGCRHNEHFGKYLVRRLIEESDRG